MKLLRTFVLSFGLLSALSAGANTEVNRRMDCRFRGTSGHGPSFCYASAHYSARFERDRFFYENVRYGVGCDRQNVFDDAGVIQQRELLGENLRPESKQAPQIELETEGALAREGSYAAKLELASGALYQGYCHVADVSENGGQPRLTDPVVD